MKNIKKPRALRGFSFYTKCYYWTMVRKKKTNASRPSKAKNQDLMKLLLATPAFKEIVADARVKLHIPPQGLPEDDAVIHAWMIDRDRESSEKMLSKELLKQLKAISKNEADKLISPVQAKEQSRLLQRTSYNFLKYTVDFIVGQFRLPMHYAEHIRTYILFGGIGFPNSNFSVGPWEANDGESLFDRKYLPITIYAKLTKKDIMELKKTMDGIFGKNLPKYDHIPKIDELLVLSDWADYKERFDEMTQTPYKIGAREIAENVLKKPRARQKVYDAKRQLKTLRKKRFGTE